MQIVLSLYMPQDRDLIAMHEIYQRKFSRMIRDLLAAGVKGESHLIPVPDNVCDFGKPGSARSPDRIGISISESKYPELARLLSSDPSWDHGYAIKNLIRASLDPYPLGLYFPGVALADNALSKETVKKTSSPAIDEENDQNNEKRFSLLDHSNKQDEENNGSHQEMTGSDKMTASPASQTASLGNIQNEEGGSDHVQVSSGLPENKGYDTSGKISDDAFDLLSSMMGGI